MQSHRNVSQSRPVRIRLVFDALRAHLVWFAVIRVFLVDEMNVQTHKEYPHLGRYGQVKYGRRMVVNGGIVQFAVQYARNQRDRVIRHSQHRKSFP